MNTFKFNTDGSIEEVGGIIMQELEIRHKGSQFDVESINDGFGNDGERLIIVTLVENELKDDGDSFYHSIEVQEVDVHEYKADLSLTW